MTLEIGILFGILLVMAFFFFTEKLPVDLTAFMGLAAMVLGGFVDPSEAFSGFASPAVITMLCIFFVSAAMLHTGLADWVGVRVHRMIGSREIPLIIAIMMVAGLLSAFMNNIAACAVLLPAVSSIAKKSGVSPSRLFMPLSFGAILGGTTTLVGTPPNILAADMLRQRGMEPFQLFDFTPLGLMILGLGVLYMITVGRKLLPERNISSAMAPSGNLAQVYELEESLFSIRIPPGSGLDGRTLAQTKLGSALGVQVAGIIRGRKKILAPQGEAVLSGGDVLVVKGQFLELQELFRVQGLEIGPAQPADLARTAEQVSGFAGRLSKNSDMTGKTLKVLKFREMLGATVVGIQRDGAMIEADLARQPLRAGDRIFALGKRHELESLCEQGGFEETVIGPSIFAELKGHLYLLHVPEESKLVGTTIGESRMGELMKLTVVGIIRESETIPAIDPQERILAHDRLIVTGKRDRIQSLQELGNVELQRHVDETGIESEEVGIGEAAVAPRSDAAGRTLAELNFRERHGLQVLAIWREGNPIHADLAQLPLRFGDALLLQGPFNKFQLFGKVADFVLLSPLTQEPRRTEKAPYALGALLLLIAIVVSGFQPIHVAAFLAAIMVVLTGAISMEEAYRAVEWRAVFLVAAILPVGIAMEETGAARLLSSTVTEYAGPLGPYAVLAGLFTLSSMLSQALDGAPSVVVLTPVALQTAEQLNLSPYPIMMGISLAASAAFMTPFSHKANLLVMGAGGYKVMDYLKVGTPLTIVILIVLVLLVPVFFPL